MQKRKHRVVVEITFDKVKSAKYAATRVNSMLTFADTRLPTMPSNTVTKIMCKQFNRVIQNLLQSHATKRHEAIQAYRAKL